MRRLLVAALLYCACPAEVKHHPTADVPLARPSAEPPASLPPTPGSSFFKTEDSDEWVARNFKLQAQYQRVLLVGEPKSKTVQVAPPSLGSARQGAIEHEVAAHFSTIQAAVDASRPGDLIAVQPGHYAGFVVEDLAGAKDGAYTFLRALGPPGAVTIDAPSADDSWMIYLRAAHHVVLEGFRVEGSGERRGPRGGIMLDGDFGHTGKLVRNVAIVGVFSSKHKTWGMHSTDTATVLVQDSAFRGSVLEHGLYVSDGSDDWVIRRNYFFDNYACGLQINLDPLASLEETMRHVGMTGHPPFAGNREWALATLARADRVYGPNNYPDGRGINFIVEDNVSFHNGKKGGAAYNFALISDSLIQNNLAYDNVAGGLVLWDNENPFDHEQRDRQPTDPAQWTDDNKPIFGSRGNLVRFNTFFDEDSPRAAIQCRNGSFDNRFFANIAIHAGPGLWFTPDSVPGLESRGDLLGAIEMDPAPEKMVTLAALMPDRGSRVGLTRDEVAKGFVAPSREPWVIVEGDWWQLNPKRPDFHPKPSAGWSVDASLPKPKRDLEGAARAATPGAFSPRAR